MDLGVPSTLKRAMAVLGMAHLVRALAVCSVPPAGSESDLYRRRPGPRLTPSAIVTVSSGGQAPAADPDDVMSNDLVNKGTEKVATSVCITTTMIKKHEY